MRGWKIRRILICAVALSLGVAGNLRTSAQVDKPDKEDSYTIRGTVVNSVTHAPIGRALVYSSDDRFAKFSDDQGHFEFKIPRAEGDQAGVSGTFTQTFVSSERMQRSILATGGVPTVFFVAKKPGYLQSENGQPGTYTTPGELSDATIPLVPEALIVGSVNLPNNEGTDKIQVEIYRREVQEGRGHWLPAGSTSTRANGEFRFAGLRAGFYKLFTNELLDRDPLTFDPRGQLYGYPPFYYPAATDFESAAVVHLKAGETFQASLTPSRLEYYRVKLGVTGSSQPAGFHPTVGLQGHRGPGYSLGYNQNEGTIEGMLPNGNYTLELVEFGQNGAAGMLNFSVNGTAVAGPTVMLVPNVPIEIRAKDERTGTENATEPGLRNYLNMMNVTLVPQDEFATPNRLRTQNPQNPEDDSLTIGTAQPGRYRVRANVLPQAYLAAVKSGGRDLFRQPLTVGFGAAVPPIEITIRNDGASVDGSIENWQQHTSQTSAGNRSGSELPVILFLPTADSTGQFCQAWANSDGGFDMTQVPPGEYLVIAFEHMPEDLEYENPEALKKYESKGQVLRLVAGQHQHLKLTLNSASD